MQADEPASCARRSGSRFESFQLRDHILDHLQTHSPESRIGRIEAERRQQLLVMLGAARAEHVEIAALEAFRRALIGGIERIHETIAEGIRIDVERGMDEVRDIGPVGIVAVVQSDRRAQALALNREPEFAEFV